MSSGSVPVPGQSDAENFTQTLDSMAIMGFTKEELTGEEREKRGRELEMEIRWSGWR